MLKRVKKNAKSFFHGAKVKMHHFKKSIVNLEEFNPMIS